MELILFLLGLAGICSYATTDFDNSPTGDTTVPPKLTSGHITYKQYYNYLVYNEIVYIINNYFDQRGISYWHRDSLEAPDKIDFSNFSIDEDEEEHVDKIIEKNLDSYRNSYSYNSGSDYYKDTWFYAYLKDLDYDSWLFSDTKYFAQRVISAFDNYDYYKKREEDENS